MADPGRRVGTGCGQPQGTAGGNVGETGAGVGAEPQDGSTVVSWTAPSFDEGNIQVESEPGEFTEIIITLPLEAPPEAAESDGEPWV